MKKGNFKNLILIFSIISFCLVFFFAGVFAFPFSKANPNITVDESNGVSIYVNGEYVVKNSDGSYSVTKDSSVTIIAINEYKIFKKLIISDGTNTKEVDNNYRMELTPSSKISISTRSVAASKDDKGNLFANPYLIDDGEDLHALSQIFAYKDGSAVSEKLVDSFNRFFTIDEGTAIDHDKAKEYRNSLLGKYYRVTDDILLSTDDFYGIGNAINPFVGCFDFLNKNIIVNVSSSSYESLFNQTTKDTADQIIDEMDIGLFGKVVSSINQPSIIRNLNVKGSLSFSCGHDPNALPDGHHISSAIMNAGGVAGKIDGNVVLRNINSAVSVSATDNCSINLGGVVGVLSTPIEKNANIVYSGANTSLNANSGGADSYASAGFLCGVLENVYCNSFLGSVTSSRIIANLTNEKTDNCNVGGVIGRIINRSQDYNELTLSNIRFKTKGELIISSSINNSRSDASSANYANAAGIYGTIECTSEKNFFINPVIIDKVDASVDSDNSLIKISATTTSAGSMGNAYAGGLFGYINAETSKKVNFSSSTEAQNKEIFCCDVDITATQNGHSQAYAGGIFAYNAYNFFDFQEKVKFVFNPENEIINIKAVQTTTATNKNDDEFHPPVCAGVFSSYLPLNYSIKNLEFNISNANVLATREIGSTASGSIYAGTIAGYAESNDNGNSSFSNIDINLKDTTIEASCLSYDSKVATSGLISSTGQNVDNLAVGSFIGHLKGYGSDKEISFDNDTISSNNPGVKDVTVNITLEKYDNTKPVINGIQNVNIVDENRALDNVSEGYVGGFIGYLEHSFIKNVSVTCTNSNKQAMIRGSGNNKPNTSAVGGLVGETYLGAASGIDSCSVNNMRVYGTAFFYNASDVNMDSKGSVDVYDLYVGGIIGVAGYNANGKVLIKDSYVKNSRIEAFGERLMLPYAGGIAGGLWWGNGAGGMIYNCSVIDSIVYSKSIRSKTYAAGITGLLQKGTISSCNVINTVVRSTTDNHDKYTYAAGITSRTRGGSNQIKDCFSNAYVTCEGPKDKKIKAGIYINGYFPKEALGSVTCSNNHYNPFYVGHKNGEAINSLYGALNLTHDSSNKVTGFSIVTTGNWNNKVYSPGCIPIVLYINSDNAYDNIELKPVQNKNSFDPYKNNIVETDKVKLSLSLSHSVYATLNNNTCTLNDGVKETDNGTLYVNLSIKINLLNEEYILSSFPVYVNGIPDRNYTIKDADIPNSNQSITNNDVSKCVSGDFKENETDANTKTYHYIQVDLSDHNHNTNAFKIDFAPFNTPNFNMYTIRDNDNTKPTITEEGLKNKNFTDASLKWILDDKNKVNITDPNSIYYSDYLYVIKEDTFITLRATEFLSHRIIAILEFYDSYVIVDYIPNYVKGITIGVSSNTPALEYDIVNNQYVYAPGDDILFETKEVRVDGTERKYNKSIIFDDIEDNNYALTTNGRMKIKSAAANETVITVYARYAGDGCTPNYSTEESKSITTSIKIIVRYSVNFEHSNLGCDFESTRKITKNSPFTFKVTPSFGYGFDPNKLIITINGVAYNLTDSNSSSRIIPLDSSTVRDDANYKVTVKGYVFNCVYTASTGAYTITIPKELLPNTVTSVSIDTEFPVVYQLSFDRGPSFTTYKDRYFVYSVKANTELNTTLRDAIGREIYVNRYGFDLQGYYLTDVGSKLESYGSTFNELCSSKAVAKVLGPMNFYARWTYNVAIEKPDGVTINSTLPLTNLETTTDGKTPLIPININNDFTFHFETDSRFAGTPDFQVFIVKKKIDNNVEKYDYTDVTSKCVYDPVDDMYSLNKDLIDGLIYIKVFTSSINLNHGETEETLIVNPNVYSDNTYTISYALNYSKDGIYRNDAAFGGGKTITFNFSKPLPAGTTLQLYRHVNKIPLDIGRLVLQDEKSSILLTDFTDISLPGDKDVGSLLDQSQFDIIHSELYYIVVTPPMYNNLTNGTEDVLNDCVVSVVAQYPDKIDKVYYNEDSTTNNTGFDHYSEDAKNYLEQSNRPAYDKDKVLYNIHKGKTISISPTGNVLSVVVSDAVKNDIVEENRHEGKVLLWCVEAPNGTKYQLTDKITPTCSTDVAHYFLVNGNFDISFVTAGYKIKLIETDDVINPSADDVVWEMTIPEEIS